MSIRVLHLVRHGAVEGDSDDPGLSDRGRQQAEVVAARLALASKPARVSAVISSTLRRAIETADIVAQAIGEVERRSDASLCEGFPTAPPPAPGRDLVDEATLRAEAVRFDQCWDTFFTGSDTPVAEVLVAHGNWIRGLAIRALGAEPSSWHRLGFNHCGITTVLVTPDGLYVTRMNDSGHLPLELQSIR